MRRHYVETSVWGVLAPGQPAEMKRASQRLLDRLDASELFASQVVLDEVELADDLSRRTILAFVQQYSPNLLQVNTECEELAQAYIDAGILPAKKWEDAMHVAISTVHAVDVLVSWNHRHMANVRKTELYRAVNLLRGYSHSPAILTPFEVMHG